MWFSSYKFILASSSPRRQQLLKDLGLDFTLEIKEVEEVYPDALKGHQITDYLSDLKSKPFENTLRKNEIVITSDTIVWVNDQALGKPKSYEDAIDMLCMLSGTSHKVITSVCLTGSDFKKIFHDTVTVYFKKLSKQEMEYYVTTFKPFDKAGSYGIQEWIGKIGITKIEGSYFTVMGLPVHKLYKELQNL
ncbi:Maf family nucleotide pyrophosphatase [Tenacibaculum sp. SG-28]|uniref:Maf family nucleotide pyrophosphatase n=1 Tax=Tenacibaculum sp. SG-28 TaxID=754426 RepID=UPI000CF4B220|nr:Maf family nucleotide pyrophosphatase [Tenacibaculum sp. SG-28]PQJ23329.1 septum formation protein Maf [Tenacibaculum sp. SG-28]